MSTHKRRTIEIPAEYEEMSITEVAPYIGVTKQRVQQIEVVALEKLRRRAKRAGLLEFLRD